MTTNWTLTSTTRTPGTNIEVRVTPESKAYIWGIHCLRCSSRPVWISSFGPPPAVSIMGDSP